jgi:hypothetical protein
MMVEATRPKSPDNLRASLLGRKICMYTIDDEERIIPVPFNDKWP